MSGIHRTRSKRRKRRILLRLYEGNCFWCGVAMRVEGAEGPSVLHAFAMTLDELHPRSRGGLCVLENQVLVHKICNNRRGSMIAPQAAFDRHHDMLQKHGLMTR